MPPTYRRPRTDPGHPETLYSMQRARLSKQGLLNPAGGAVRPDANADIDLCLKHADDRLFVPLAFAIISGAGGAATCPLQPLLVDLSSRKRKTARQGRLFC